MLAMAAPLAHAEWRHLATNPEGQFFYDDAVQREGDRVNVWRMTDFAKPLTNLEGKEVRSDKSRTTVDCANAKLANSQVTRYAGAQAQGEVMNHYDTPLRLLMQKVCVN